MPVTPRRSGRRRSRTSRLVRGAGFNATLRQRGHDLAERGDMSRVGIAAARGQPNPGALAADGRGLAEGHVLRVGEHLEMLADDGVGDTESVPQRREFDVARDRVEHREDAQSLRGMDDLVEKRLRHGATRDASHRRLRIADPNPALSPPATATRTMVQAGAPVKWSATAASTGTAARPADHAQTHAGHALPGTDVPVARRCAPITAPSATNTVRMAGRYHHVPIPRPIVRTSSAMSTPTSG